MKVLSWFLTLFALIAMCVAVAYLFIGNTSAPGFNIIMDKCLFIGLALFIAAFLVEPAWSWYSTHSPPTPR